MSYKKCITCRKTLPNTLDHFPKDKKYRDGLKTQCISCRREYEKNYRTANHTRLIQRQRLFDKSPKGIYRRLKQSIRGHLVTITQEKFVEWYKSQPKKCFYCGLPEENLQLVLDAYNNKTFRLSLDRIDSARGYEEGNLVLCCLRCNHIKGDFFTQSEMVEIGQKFIARRWMDGQEI